MTLRSSGKPGRGSNVYYDGVIVTGAAGRVGRMVLGVLPGAIGVDRSNGDLIDAIPDLRAYHTVVHLAGLLSEDLESAASNLAMTMNVLRACQRAGVRRLIWASSVRADEPLIGMTTSWYGAAKAAQEQLLRAWAAENSKRTAVALRLGHYCPGSAPQPEHEALRLNEAGLDYWVRRALAHPVAGLTTWHAAGCLLPQLTTRD
jgi:nucleoside-diphosphate-sugar epimerase